MRKQNVRENYYSSDYRLRHWHHHRHRNSVRILPCHVGTIRGIRYMIREILDFLATLFMVASIVTIGAIVALIITS